jgi:hypothetical protein
MDILAFLVVLLVGVILGYWLQNPALAERERAMRQKLRRAKALQSDAWLKVTISQDQLRLVQAVREQTVAMLNSLGKAKELDLRPAEAPIYENMLNWLAPTGAMPTLELDELTHQPVPPDDEPEPAARERFSTPVAGSAPKRKPGRRVSVDVGGDIRSELVVTP